MRNPNGYGSVVKLSGNRRKPFVVRKTVGWNDKGYPVYQTIGYYPTREAGMIALAEYNKAPWDIDAVLTLETEKVDLEAKTIQGGIKTISAKQTCFTF